MRPQAEHDALQQARLYQQTEAFRHEYKRRAGVEGTISQAVRAFGLRQARYVGLAKTHVQEIGTAVALDLCRWVEVAPPETAGQDAHIPLCCFSTRCLGEFASSI